MMCDFIQSHTVSPQVIATVHSSAAFAGFFLSTIYQQHKTPSFLHFLNRDLPFSCRKCNSFCLFYSKKLQVFWRDYLLYLCPVRII